MAAAELSAGQIELQSGRDATLGAIEANADSLRIHPGGQLKLQTASTLEQSARQATAGSSASVSASGKGATDETLRYNQLNARQLSIDAKGGIAAQAGQHVNLDQLARQPGLGWVDQIRNDPKLATSAQTQWQRVQEAHDQWEYRQSGMGPVSAALVAVMVGAVAAPAAASAGAAAGGAAGAATGSAMAGTAAGGAVQAGVLALSNQVGASFFNNGGDLGKVFKELGESESVKNLATAIVTGGVLSGMGFNPLGLPTPGSGALKFFTQLANNLQTQTASALIRTAINGGSLEDSLQDALKNALINSMAASAANGIGDLKEAGALNGFTNKIAHLMAGCAAGAAKSGGGDGCAPGAIGAAVGELAAEGIGRTDNTVYMAGLFGGLAAALAGGDNEAVAIANWAGSNAAANNYMTHPELASPRGTPQEQQAKSLANNAKVENACMYGTEQGCGNAIAKVGDDINGLRGYRAELEGKQAAATDATTRTQLGNQIKEVEAHIASAENAIRVGLMASNDGNINLTGLSPDELMGIGFALGAIEAGGVTGSQKIIGTVAKWKAASANAAAESKIKTESNARRDDGQQYDTYRKDSPSTTGGDWNWDKQAPNGGAVPGTSHSSTMRAGDTLDRYGSRRGAYMSPAGTPFEQRALPPGKQAEPYEQFKVLKEFSVLSEEIAPAYGQLGGGQQLRAKIPEVQNGFANINDLIKFKYLEEPKGKQ